MRRRIIQLEVIEFVIKIVFRRIFDFSLNLRAEQITPHHTSPALPRERCLLLAPELETNSFNSISLPLALWSERSLPATWQRFHARFARKSLPTRLDDPKCLVRLPQMTKINFHSESNCAIKADTAATRKKFPKMDCSTSPTQTLCGSKRL